MGRNPTTDCCQGTGLADYAAVPCPNPECAARTDAPTLAFALTEDEVACIGIGLLLLRRQTRHNLTIDPDPDRWLMWDKLFRESGLIMDRFGIDQQEEVVGEDANGRPVYRLSGRQPGSSASPG